MSTNGLSVGVRDHLGRRKITNLARNNKSLYKVICAGEHRRLLVVTVPPGHEIVDDARDDADQILFIVTGKAQAVLDEDVKTVAEREVLIIPAGTRHKLKNLGPGRLKLFSVYSPPATAFIF